jgi:SAM-dependent methyltransferase
VAVTPKALPEVHIAVRGIIERAFPSTKDRVVIDAAAGNGYMSEWLHGNGFSVLPFDIKPSGFAGVGMVCAAADLNHEIPARDNTSDLTVSIETIEHLENPFQFVREVARVTKPGGLIVVSTPNVMFVRGRLKALFTGTPTYFEFVEKDPWGQHIMPFSIGQLMYAFDRCNLGAVEVEAVRTDKMTLSRGVFEVVNGLTWLGALALKTKRRHYPDHFMNRLTPAQLWELGRGNILVITARKPAA